MTRTAAQPGQPARRIALLGHGPIALYVIDQLEKRPALQIQSVLCRPGREDWVRRELAGTGTESPHVLSDADRIDPQAVDLVVDCTGHEGLMEHGPGLLARGIDVLSISTGALSDAEALSTLERAADRGGARLRFAVGAIGGIDALAAAAVGHLSRVVYVGRKPPAGWRGTPAEQSLDLARLREPAIHFEGTAREASARYPKNANVAAMVALAGLGLDATQVTLIADPTLERNHHTVEAEGAFGSFRMDLEGTSLPENPKSSALAAMSLVRAIESLLCHAVFTPVGIIGTSREISSE